MSASEKTCLLLFGGYASSEGGSGKGPAGGGWPSGPSSPQGDDDDMQTR